MTKIVVFGSGGRAGSATVREARARGLQVTEVTRQLADVTDPVAVEAAARGHDVAVAAVYDRQRDPAEFLPAATQALVTGLTGAGVARVVWVGLASVLPDATGTRLMDTDGYPQEYRAFMLAHAAALQVLEDSALDWVAVSPSGDFHDGTPLGGYRVAPADAASRITYDDHAIAVVDEARRAPARRAHVGVVGSG